MYCLRLIELHNFDRELKASRMLGKGRRLLRKVLEWQLQRCVKILSESGRLVRSVSMISTESSKTRISEGGCEAERSWSGQTGIYVNFRSLTNSAFVRSNLH